MTRYLELALAGDSASANDWNEHLIAFHRAFPNVTPELIGTFQTANGESSYQRLAREVYEQFPIARRIVDVGCGSGELMRHLDVAFKGAVELTGIDLVESELDLARRRVAGATLVCGDVSQTLPFDMVDVVVAHLSLLSMARLRDALCRIYDVLRPGGALIFVIEDSAAADSVVAMMAPLMRALYDRYPGVRLAVPERDSVENEVTLRGLLKTAGFTGEITVDELVLSAKLSPDQLLEFALKTYPFGLLEASTQSELREHLRANLEHGENGARRVKLPLKLVTARRSSAISSEIPSAAMEYKQ